MSKPPKSASGKKPKAEAPDGGEPESIATQAAAPKAAAKAKKPPKAKQAAEPVDVEADEPVAKPVAPKAPASKGAGDAAMSKRLSEMTDFQLRAYQMSTTRISRDVAHAKSASSKDTLAMIEIEMARRVATPGLAPSGTRAPVASPKQGKK